MTELFTAGVWLLQQAAPLRDTVVTLSPKPGWFETVASVASATMSVTLVVLTIFLAPAAWDFYKTFRKTKKLLDRIEGDVQPLIRNAGIVFENLNHITATIRNNVDAVSATITLANERLNEAIASTETRINEFNALLHVAQEEAEEAFVSTAAVVHGVKTGAAAFGSSGDLEIADDGGGDDDGDDGESNEDTDQEHERAERARGAPARPRLKPQRSRG
jgi:uncharacterized protein YoxC